MRGRKVLAAVAGALSGLGVAGLGVALSLHASAGLALTPLRQGACGPLHVLDRYSRPLRDVPASCGHRGRGRWVALSEIPEILRQAVIVFEDQRFLEHAGVDALAVARAAFDNVRAGRVVSGASTLTMQLMRMLHHPRAARSVASKLEEAWLALAAETQLSKDDVLEAYLNHAYYGRGAYGVAEAAERFFGKPPGALTLGEATLLAVLPRAPGAYDPLAHLGAARARRDRVLGALVNAGRLSPAEREAVARERLHVARRGPRRAFEAPHFVDWVVAQLPEAERRRGGRLVTTLDLALQRRIERAVSAHVARLSNRALTDAAVVVLATRSAEVVAMVGSSDYARSQLNLTLRRRHPGSLLKPFVYALAIEGGRPAPSLAYDVGDVPSNYKSDDWVGREGGPLPLRQALAGSYNLAAVHLLEEVGVRALYDRLRALGVADAPQPPERYGLSLALGATRVRLLDVAAGFGVLVREGRTRRARGIDRLERAGRRVYRPDAAGERGFAPDVAWLVMDMLSDPANRHRRFGEGLPVEGYDPRTPRARAVVKTGTASGMSDLMAVVASREFLVGAWAGRLDGKAAHGLSGMWGAAPLARRALDIALAGRAPSLPERPDGVVVRRVCKVSGMTATARCPETIGAYALAGHPGKPCDWHRAVSRGPNVDVDVDVDDYDHDYEHESGRARVALVVPEELRGWLARSRASGATGRPAR